MNEGTASCVAKMAGPPAGDKCSLEKSEALKTADYEALAATASSGIALLDFTEFFCPVNCEPVLFGGVIYSDSHHMTKTFSETFVKPLRDRLIEAGLRF